MGPCSEIGYTLYTYFLHIKILMRSDQFKDLFIPDNNIEVFISFEMYAPDEGSSIVPNVGVQSISQK